MQSGYLTYFFLTFSLPILLAGCIDREKNKSYTLNAALAFLLRDINSSCRIEGTLAGEKFTNSFGLTFANTKSDVVLFKDGNNAATIKVNFENDKTLEFSPITTDLNEASFTYYETDSCPINSDLIPGRTIPQESFTIDRGKNLTLIKTTQSKSFIISININRNRYPSEIFTDISVVLKD